MILLEYQNIKTFLEKTMFLIGFKTFLGLKKSLCRGHTLLVILKAKKLLQRFTKKNCKNQIKSLELKAIKRKADKLYIKWKGYNSSFNSSIDKKDSINEWIFSRTEIFRKNSQSLIRYVYLFNKSRFIKWNRRWCLKIS